LFITSPVSGLEVNVPAVFIWGIVVGYIFTTVGAAGAILTFIGQVVIFGLDKAMISFLKAKGMTEKVAKDITTKTLKVHNLTAVIISPLIAVPRYWMERRVAIPLALCIAVGVVIGALAGPSVPMTLKQYKFWFGVITFLIGIRLAYECTETYRRRKEKLVKISKAFEEKVKELKATGRWEELKEKGYKLTKFGATEMRFEFVGEEFVINPVLAAIGGFFIAFIASLLGLGGGFLLVPYLSSVFVLPMFLVSGTSITIVLINSLVAIGRYLQLGGLFDPYYMGPFLAGVVIGAFIGPWSQKFYKEKWLRGLIAAILLFYGLRFMGVWKKLGIPI